MNKSQKIRLSTDNLNTDKHIKVKLEQDVDSLEFLTMSIDSKDVYQDFNADYGVLVGRVIANDGIGVPNAKISIFIPLSDEDADNGSIVSLYPYKTPRDKNNEGKRYNLLPRVAKIDPVTNIVSPKQPFGSFPIKEEVVTNETLLNIHKKYYKYTALTNAFGDYMIFGVPIGVQTVHLSVDITDIGKYSMTPASMVTNLGYSANLFTDDGSKIKESSDLNDLPNIETQEISVDIIPFWGDVETFEIGISQQNFRIRSTLKNTFAIFGSVFTDGDFSMWGEDYQNAEETYILYHMMDNGTTNAEENASIKTKRVAKVTEKIYYYPPSVTDAEITSGSAINRMQVLSPTEYSVYKRDGDFVFIINCNRDKVVINEDGTQTPVSEESAGGLFTTFKGFFTLEIEDDTLPMTFTSQSNHVKIKPLRQKLKFPQHAAVGRGLRREDNDLQANADNDAWRKQIYSFTGGGLYSVAKFHGTVFNSSDEDSADNFRWTNNAYSVKDRVNSPTSTGQEIFSVGVIQVNDYGNSTGNTVYEMENLANATQQGGLRKFFAANWLNFSIYLPQTGWVYDGYSYVSDWRSNTQFTHNNKRTYFMQDNLQQIAGSIYNTKWFARSDLHWTDIIQVTKDDILAINTYTEKGFTNMNLSGLNGKYRNAAYVPPGWSAACPLRLPRNDDPNPTIATQIPNDGKTYFYKGFDSADCIQFLISLGLV